MQGLFNICKSINVIHHINKLKNKNHKIILIDTEKFLTKFNTHFWEKNYSEGGHRENLPQHHKSHIWQSYHPQQKVSLLRPATRQECPLSPLLFNIALEVPAMAIREEKEIKGIQIGNEDVKLSLFADDMILHIENPKEATRKLIELINEFWKVAGYKINTQKSITFLHTDNKRSEREIRETIPFTTASKRIKHLLISLPKETKDLHSEKHKTLMREIKTNTDRKIYHALGLQELILSKRLYYSKQSIVQCNPYQTTSDIHLRTRTKYFKICLETYKYSLIAKAIVKKKKNWRNQAPWLQSTLQSYSHQNSMVLTQKQK